MSRVLNIIKKIILLPSYLSFNLIQSFRKLPVDGKNILFAINDGKVFGEGANSGNDRYIFFVINAFRDAGYNIYFYQKRDFITFTRLGRYVRPIYKLANVKCISKVPVNTKDMILVFDNIQAKLFANVWKELVYINIFKPPFCKIGELITVPFLMQPIRYYWGQHKNLSKVRANERKIRVFFGGNTSGQWYQNPLLKRQGQLTRLEALDALMGAGTRIRSIGSIKELRDIMAGSQYLNECRIWKSNEHSNSSLQEVVSQWLDIISKSDFFLCFSGTDLPMCHNAIESMAVGTIPIIAYHDWFTPPLEHRKNAIVFSGTEDLVSKVNEVFNMSAEEIREMRQNVIKYYEEHLNPQSFVRKFEATAKELNTLMLYPKLVCSDYDNRQAKVLLNDLNANLQKYLT